MAEIESRCTQCGTENINTMYEPRNGSGRKHGVEVTDCDTCDEETVQNRCGRSVPSNDRR